ncbi:MAG: response regulator [Lewinella sp.]|nr:response regulator [Lewinella sp.]
MKYLAVVGWLFCALGLSAQAGQVPEHILHLCDRGVDHYSSGTLDTAVLLFLEAEFQALELPEPAQQALSLEAIGQYYLELDFRGQSLVVYEKALSIRQTLGDTASVADILAAMGGIHFEFLDCEQASVYWQQARPLLEQARKSERLGEIEEKIGLCYDRQQRGPEDSLTILAHMRVLQQQAIDHLFEKVLLQVDLEEEKQELAYALQLKQEQALLRSTVLILILATLLLGSLFVLFQMKRKANHDLARLNQEISGQKTLLVQQNEKLEELDRMKSHFFTNISHEFRTPLTIIEGAVYEIRHTDGPVDKALDVIARNNRNLLQLVNQILDLRKLEAGKMKLDLVQGDVISYLNYVLESFQTLAASQQKTLHFVHHDAGIVMDFDPEKLLQIVSNLLSNAIKYTPEGKDIYVLVQRQSQGKDGLLLTVKDSGIGIPKDKLPYVFDRFYQLDDWIYRREESTGIGLALTQELVKLMGGAITVQSEPGRGTSFIAQLPVTKQAPLQADNRPRQPLPARSADTPLVEEVITPSEGEDLPYLLLIEDNPDVVQYTAALLKDHYRLAVAGDGEKGLRIALESVPDLIISDLKMPRKNGYEVCEVLKNDHRTSHIPIVLVSAQTDQDARNEGFRSGADAYLSKPFNREELFIRLKQLIELRRRLRQRYQSLAPLAPSNDPVFQKEDAFIADLQATIDEHLDDENFGIPELCKAIGMSRSQLHLKIKALTNRSTSHYIRGYRLMRAREMFNTTELNVTEVAFEVGFRDAAYFSRSFSSEFGLSPRDYQKTVGQAPR